MDAAEALRALVSRANSGPLAHVEDWGTIRERPRRGARAMAAIERDRYVDLETLAEARRIVETGGQ